jgi:hypothetical protein
MSTQAAEPTVACFRAAMRYPGDQADAALRRLRLSITTLILVKASP